MDHSDSGLPPIPAKRYFTIGEVSELCHVKPYVLRYWEQEFVQLKPMKRRGNRRYYQHHEVLLIRRIRELLYEQGFTISGARNQLAEAGIAPAAALDDDDVPDDDGLAPQSLVAASRLASGVNGINGAEPRMPARALQVSQPLSTSEMAWLALRGGAMPDLSRLDAQAAAELREALLSIRDLLV
jgi:DNA-binding transcriptional MerR regulator